MFLEAAKILIYLRYIPTGTEKQTWAALRWFASRGDAIAKPLYLPHNLIIFGTDKLILPKRRRPVRHDLGFSRNDNHYAALSTVSKPQDGISRKQDRHNPNTKQQQQQDQRSTEWEKRKFIILPCHVLNDFTKRSGGSPVVREDPQSSYSRGWERVMARTLGCAFVSFAEHGIWGLKIQ